MTNFSCEKCGKEFNSKSHYTQHQKRKTPCVNKSKIKELIKSVEEKSQNLIAPIHSVEIKTNLTWKIMISL
jgi:uncharacterized C2H2 Zn-finger protein